jgi:hypothetical protein
MKLCLPPSVPTSVEVSQEGWGKERFLPAAIARRCQVWVAVRPHALVGLAKLFRSFQLLESVITASAITAAAACGFPKPGNAPLACC